MSEDMIFVFGSNKSGIHGAGAARYAYKNLGAEWGVGEGPTGKCYALPTKGKKIEFISIDEVEEAIITFLHYARKKPDLTFKVTAVGCGLGGFTHDQIAPFFRYAPKNCRFDKIWEPYLGKEHKYWGSFSKD